MAQGSSRSPGKSQGPRRGIRDPRLNRSTEQELVSPPVTIGSFSPNLVMAGNDDSLARRSPTRTARDPVSVSLVEFMEREDSAGLFQLPRERPRRHRLSRRLLAHTNTFRLCGDRAKPEFSASGEDWDNAIDHQGCAQGPDRDSFQTRRKQPPAAFEVC